MQDSQANCGPFALKNALAALGIERSAEELEKACRTSATNGTSVKNLIAAASQIEGCDPQRIREKRRSVAMLTLEHAIRSGRPAVLVWNSEQPGDHYVAVFAMLGERYQVADSGDSELVYSLTAVQLDEKWIDGGVYEGVVL